MALLQRDSITITRQGSPVSDGAGGSTYTTVTVYSGRAVVKPIKPGRNLEAAQVQLKEAVTVEIWRSELVIQANDLLTWRGKTYAIQGPLLPTDSSERIWKTTALLTETES